MGAKKPLIGIVAREIDGDPREWYPKRHGVIHSYFDAITEAGGIPVLIPFITDQDTIKQLHQTLDGIMFAGGGDIHPKFYNEQPLHSFDRINEDQDRFELTLIGWTILDRKPLLGICRGMQLVNVAMGGTLYQDIATQFKTEIDHYDSLKSQDFAKIVHEMLIEPGTRLSEILKQPTVPVNSLHHQGIKDLAKDLKVTARAEDGLIEAVEADLDMYLVGIQGHPEVMALEVDPSWRRIFDDFVAVSASKSVDSIARK